MWVNGEGAGPAKFDRDAKGAQDAGATRELSGKAGSSGS
jgi:hypothetical protein